MGRAKEKRTTRIRWEERERRRYAFLPHSIFIEDQFFTKERRMHTYTAPVQSKFKFLRGANSI
jgi:inner membrane protein involved in colicin E2 resistance